MLNKTSGNIDFSEKMSLKCLKKVNKTIIYNFFLPFHPSTLFMKCNGYTTTISQKTLILFNLPLQHIQVSVHVRISFLMNINFKDQPCNCFCDVLDTNAIRDVKLIKNYNKKVKSKWR